MPSSASVNLTDHFLIAMPAMSDPCFSKTLIYVAEHDEQGALGVIVNKPIDMELASLLEKIEVPVGDGRLGKQPVFFGGPVQTDRGFVLHRPLGRWQSTLAVNESIGLTTSIDILRAIAQQGAPQDIIVSLGYSGWGAGQLESELAQNAWLTVPANPAILFELPFEERLQSALRLLGVDFAGLVAHAGHA